MNLLSYVSLVFSRALITSTFLLFFSSLSCLERLSIGEMNHSQTKKIIIRAHSTIESGTLKAVNKLPRIKDGAKTQNTIDARLNIKKDPLSKIFLLSFFLSRFNMFHSQLIKIFMQFLYLFISIKKGCDTFQFRSTVKLFN